MNIDIDNLRCCLREGTVEVNFTKLDGSERIMTCTTNIDMLPAIDVPIEYEEKEYDDLIKVYDVDIQEWRSFRPSRVNSWQVVD